MTDKKTILIADDEIINQMIFEEILSELFNISFVENGADCVESVKLHRPGLILMDVSMPIMGGLEACRIIKAMDTLCTVPIIFVSALAAQSEIEIGLEAGGSAYIIKPFDEDELLETISDTLM